MSFQKYSNLILTTLLLLGVGGGIWWWSTTQEEVLMPQSPLVDIPEEEGVSEDEGTEMVSGGLFVSLLEKEYQGGMLTVGETLEETATYTKSAITYPSGGLTISGVLYVPKTTPPASGFPVLLTNHGYIDPAVYTTGRGLRREQEYFASRGFVVLHPDYRNHAASTKSDEDPLKMRLGYIEDIISAVLALKNSSLSIEKENITLLGHSMGGGATLAAAIVKPDIAKQVILYAPVSLNYQDSYERYMNEDLLRKQKVEAVYGTPESNPTLWQGLNGEPFVHRIAIPVKIYHGTSDDDVPLAWSEKTNKLLEEAGKDVELIVYPGEEHEFGPRFVDFMSSSLNFIQSR